MLVVIMMIFILLLIYAYWTQRFSKNMDLPAAVPAQWPIIGCAHELLGKTNNSKDLLKLLCRYGEYSEANDGVAHAFFGPFLIFFVTDPDDCITIMNSCLEKNWAYEFGRSWLGDGLVTVTSNLGIWKRHRRIITRAFNQQVLDGYVGIFNKQARCLVDEMTAKVDTGPFDHFNLLEDMSLGTVYQTTMGITEDDVSIMARQECKEAIRTMLRIITKRFQNFLLLSPFIYKFTSLKKLEEQEQTVLHRTSLEVINRKRIALQNTDRVPTKFKSFLDLLLELPPQEAFTDREIREEVETMIVAGSDTSATMLTYCLILLGSHQDIQDNVYEEIKGVLGASNRDVEKQDLSKLVFMEAVLLESMRLYPILPAMIRYATTDVKLRSSTLPAGTTIFLHVYNMHRSMKLWGPDAEEYVPQRWLPVPPPAARAFAGFSLGKRGCIGRTFAMMSMKITLVHLLRHFRVIADVTKLECQVDTFLKPASGCEIALQQRR